MKEAERITKTFADKIELIEPEKYNGYYGHPIRKDGPHKVKKAMISKSLGRFGYDLEIFFENGKRHYDWSETKRGCKQIFAYQCKAGSKWKKCT